METPKARISVSDFEGFDTGDKYVGNINKRLLKMERTTDEVRLDSKRMWTAIQELQEELKKVTQANRKLESRVVDQDKEIEELKEENKSSNEEIHKLREQNKKLEQEREELVRKINNTEELTRSQNRELENFKDMQKGWNKNNEEEQLSFRKILSEQNKENKENLEKKVVKILKTNENIVRDVADKKKCIIVTGINEEEIENRIERTNTEIQKIKKLMQVVMGDEDTANEIEEFYRLGKFENGKRRPMKIKFRAQAIAQEVLTKTWKLSKEENFKNVWIQKDMNVDERNKTKELLKEAKQKNDTRTVQEATKFYWRVIDLEIKKWYYSKAKKEQLREVWI